LTRPSCNPDLSQLRINILEEGHSLDDLPLSAMPRDRNVTGFLQNPLDLIQGNTVDSELRGNRSELSNWNEVATANVRRESGGHTDQAGFRDVANRLHRNFGVLQSGLDILRTQGDIERPQPKSGRRLLASPASD